MNPATTATTKRRVLCGSVSSVSRFVSSVRYSLLGTDSRSSTPVLSPKLSTGMPALFTRLHEQIGERRAHRRRHVTIALDVAGASDKRNRHVHVRMDVPVAHAAADHHQRVIEQVAVAVGRGAHLLDQIGEQLHVPRAQLGVLRQVVRVVAVVRHGVMRFVQSDLRIHARALFRRRT